MRALSFGIQPVIHAMGDRALDLTLSVIEQTPSNTRIRIEQAALLNPALLERLKQLNVAISIQPKVISTEFTVWSANQRLGSRAKWLHPLKTLLNAGVVVAAGSDCPMEPLNPMLGIQELLLHPNPEQRLSLDEALSLYTINAARCSEQENTKGSIEAGKLADLIILNTDPSTVEPHKINTITPDFVILNGQILVVTT
jgi:predicted amidohydrolase YtcJ